MEMWDKPSGRPQRVASCDGLLRNRLSMHVLHNAYSNTHIVAGVHWWKVIRSDAYTDSPTGDVDAVTVAGRSDACNLTSTI